MDGNDLFADDLEAEQPPGDIVPQLVDESAAEGIGNENVAAPDSNGDSEEQLCKICRLGSEEGNPLYYPCKCSVRTCMTACEVLLS